ncbi:MAG TPA: hypothetical protein VJU86_12860 [Pyrinomonadaceae bacterium]|nr:hypothetical protein [Pyrinomonadaceae bacterium]
MSDLANSSENSWPFDQQPNVAAITTRQVIDDGRPILQVTHYYDDHSWSFMCGTTENPDDYRLVHMADVLKWDDSLRSIADLPPGWSAWRNEKDSEWERHQEAQT